MSFFLRNMKSAPLLTVDPEGSVVDDVLKRMEETLDKSLVPRINMQETENGYHLEADLPGVNKDDVEIVVKANFLVIRGNKKVRDDEREAQYHQRERLNGPFYRAVPMPKDIDKDQINAELRDGVLQIDIKKSENILHAEKRISIS